MFADRVQYREYERLLVDLHALIATNRGDDDEAMAVRDRMEQVEADLTDSEILRLNALSGDLSMTHDREIPDLEVVARVPADQLPTLLSEAYQRSDWELFLEYLRAPIPFLSLGQIAYMRARAYAELGEFAPAVAFMDEAARRNPSNPNFPALALEQLWSDRRYDEAYGRAARYLSEARTPARLVLVAAGIVSRLAKTLFAPPDLAARATAALDRIELAAGEESSPSIRFAGFGTLGLIAAHIGYPDRAARAIERALAMDDVVDRAVLRGLLLEELGAIRGGPTTNLGGQERSRKLADLLAPRVSALAA